MSSKGVTSRSFGSCSKAFPIVTSQLIRTFTCLYLITFDFDSGTTLDEARAYVRAKTNSMR